MASAKSPDNLTLPVSDPQRSKERLHKDSAMTKRGAYAALSYMACAVLLVMFNKAALSSYNFPMCKCHHTFSDAMFMLVPLCNEAPEDHLFHS
ncbi:hypothetical protein F0562_009419 [Nyssa sinensis]|uniref:Uncharacterized protein n=1 Tax=Nyssa sinensis TaxID=561372 RepID=A0A5J4ZYU1_9ASTE|nr:hypothetical protein F0562_009419 [Nyssa sinensis]